MPRHSVRQHWNEQMAHTISKHNGVTLFICRAFDHVDEREITLSKKFVVASKESKG